MRSAVVVGIAIWLGSEFGRVAVFPETGAAILFLPYAVLAAALLLSPPRRWWMYLLASFVGHMMVDIVDASRPTMFAVSTEVANAIRALVVAAVWRRVDTRPPRFDTFKSTALFLTIAGLIAPAVAAFVGAAVTVLNGQVENLTNAYARVWAAWYLSNAVVGLTILPFILIVAARFRDWRRWMSRPRALETAALALGLSAAAAVLCGGIDAGLSPSIRLYAPLPFLIWAATRFGPGATSSALVVISAAVVAGVIGEGGAFTTRPTESGVLTAYVFLSFTSIPSLLLASLVLEREAAAAALRAGAERYRLAATAGGVGVWDWRLDTNELYVDPNLKTFLGYEQHEVRDHVDDWFRHVHPDDLAAAHAAANPVMSGSQDSWESEYRLKHKDGSDRWVLTRGVAVREPDATVRRLIGTTTDITVRKRAELARSEVELELRVRQRELAHLGRVTMLGQLSGALTHELRQPLTAILTNAHTAQRLLGASHLDVPAMREILDDIITADARAGEVIHRLRRLLKRGEPTLEPLELDSVVEDGLELVNADLIARGVVVKTALSPSLPPVRGDRVELQQVLINLVLNACDSMSGNAFDDRCLTIGTTSDDAGYVVAYVSDCGSGIQSADVEQIFQPFVTTKPTGLGLGLAISRSIATAHHGKLWATNNPDRGATFRLALPPHAA